MENKWLILIPILFVVGCSTPVKTRTETVEVARPILYCPAPNTEVLQRPQSLPIESITATTEQGEVVVLYKATVRTLIDYTNRLELMLNQYNNFNMSYEELRRKLDLQNTE